MALLSTLKVGYLLVCFCLFNEANPAMPISRLQLFALLDQMGIAHETRDHEAVFTVAESTPVKASMPGGHSKNLFVKDKKGALILVTAWAETPIDLVALGKHLGVKGRLSFGKPDLMQAILGVEPGSVTPFALANESAKQLQKVIIDKAFFGFERVWFHPLENTASTAILPNDLLKFMEGLGFQPEVLPLAQIKRPQA